MRASLVALGSTIPPDWLVPVARERLFDEYNLNTSVAHATKALESSAARGNEEASLLLGAMRRNVDITKFGDLRGQAEMAC